MDFLKELEENSLMVGFAAASPTLRVYHELATEVGEGYGAG
jgi:hypothetical protein